MSLAFLHRVVHVLVNLSFLFLLGLFFLYVSSSHSAPIFRHGRSPSSNPDGCKAIKVLDRESKCFYARMCNPCQTRGYIDYTILFYCVFGDYPALGYIFFALWLIVLFYLLGNTASEYFCSSLEGLSRALNLSPTIAGVTLLSLGNGAPDVFATVVSFAQGGGDGSSAEIGLSSVLGGAFFVSSSVLGVIGICIGCSSRPMVAIHRLSFVRDLCFLLAALCFLLLILFLGRIHVLGAMGFVCLYIIYVIVVSMTQCCRKEVGEGQVPLLESVEVVQHQANVKEFPSEATLFNSFEEVSTFSSCCLFLSLIELPLHLPRRLTIPVVREKEWSKPFAVASVSLSPLLLAALWNSKIGDISLEQSTAIFSFAALLGMVLGIFAMECTEESHPPKTLLLPWLAGGFLMSVVWTYITAGELVSLLVSIGNVLGVRPSVLGVTVLAWGNSIGDLTANVALAVNGGEDGARAAIAGCYGGPIFTTLVGLGLSLVLSSWNAYPSPFVIANDSSQFVLIGFIVAGLLWTLVVLYRKEMKLDGVLGVGLLAIYSCFLCFRLLESMQLLQIASFFTVVH